MKFYIAFSIAGTNTFLVATKEAPNVVALGAGFRVVQSRRPLYDEPKDGIKVEWSGLLRKTDNKPFVSPGAVIRAFNKLARDEWIIVPDTYRAFCKKHYNTSEKNK